MCVFVFVIPVASISLGSEIEESGFSRVDRWLCVGNWPILSD